MGDLSDCGISELHSKHHCKCIYDNINIYVNLKGDIVCVFAILLTFAFILDICT